MTTNDSATRVEMAIRAAHLAKCVLELLSISPELASLQLRQISEDLLSLRQWLEVKLGER